jgi:molybdopterin molybdotransferase
VIFELLVKPFLFMMMGHDHSPGITRLPAGEDYSRSKADRISWIPVRLDAEGRVVPAGYHGSAHIHSLADAWGIMKMEKGSYSVKKGEMVYVRQI